MAKEGKEAIKQIETKEEFEELINGKKPVLVDFFAVWCGPCQMMGPILEQMAEEYKNIDKVEIAKVDIDLLKDLAMQYGVMSVPTFMIFQEGKQIETMVGMRPQEEFQEKLDLLVKQ